jgi:alkylation response protein AidB-like acyl-CoA dehydrogenase
MTMDTITPVPAATDWADVAHQVGAELQPAAAAHDRSGELSMAAYDCLRTSGLSAALVPLEFGGGGASHAELGEMLRIIGRYDPATAVAFAMHSHLVAAQVWRHQHGIDSSGVLRKVADGAILATSGASDWLGSSGTVRRVDGGYRVTARKTPVSGCEAAQVFVTSFRWDDAPDGPQVLHGSVPFSAEGVTIERTWDTLGMRATGSHTVVLTDVFVPDAAISLTRPADRWHPIWTIVLGSAMPLIMAAYLGIADRAVELARQAVAGSEETWLHHRLGDLVNAHTTADDVVAGMFRHSDGLWFEPTDEHASGTLARKTVAAETMIETVRIAVEVAGGRGYARSSELERLLRDIHGCVYHPLPRPRQTELTGRVAAGLSPAA